MKMCKGLQGTFGAASEEDMEDRGDNNTCAALPSKYNKLFLATKEDISASKDLQEAITRPEAEPWPEARHKEISGMVTQHVFKLKDLP
jgi:hypothetical protein